MRDSASAIYQIEPDSGHAREDEIPHGYKRSEVGVIPENWLVKPVATFGSVVTGATPSTTNDLYWGEDYPWVTPTDITTIRDIFATERCITEAGLRSIRRLPQNSVLVTCIASIGKNAILRRDGACNQQINAVVPNDSYDANFLYYVFLNNKNYLLANAGVTATSIISKRTFSGLVFPVPPTREEQEVIAEMLGDADELIESLQQLIAKNRAIKQGAMQALLTGRQRLPGFADEWTEKSLAELAEFSPGEYLAKSDYRDGRFVVQGAGSEMGMHDSANFPTAVTVVGRVGTVGNPRFIQRGCWVNNNAAALVAEANVSNAEFLQALLETVSWATVTSVTAQPFLEVSTLMRLRFKVPKLEEQSAIATVLSDMDAEIEALEARLAKTRALKAGMMQALLTGRIRLPLDRAA